MEGHILDHNVDALVSYIAAEKAKGLEEEFLSGKLERALRERALELARLPNQTVKKAAKKHVDFVIKLCKLGTCGKSQAVVVLQDLFEVSRNGRCELLFCILEENMAEFKQPPLVDACKTFILRMCNDLLKRLSRTVETSFCGRILFFLSRYFPLGEKSGLNFVGHFNTQNTTQFVTTDAQPVDLMATTTPDDEQEEMEIGEIKESKETSIPVDHTIYTMFWQMQTYFSNPVLCYEKEQWAIFQKNSSEVISLFNSYKLEKSGSEDRKSKKTQEQTIDESDYFAKYLTSPKLLQLQLNDSQFRRYFLLQFIIVCQYLIADVRFKTKAHVLTEDQSRFVLECQDKCYKLLKETHPRGTHFTDSVKSILQREREWSAWKNGSCPDMTLHADKQPMQAYRKRPRTAFDPSVIDLGSAELTKLWNIEPDILKACRNAKRKFAPTLVEFIRDPLDESDPEQQVDEAYKSVNDGSFQWRASRFLLSRSSSYLTSSGTKGPNSTIGSYLENVIFNTAKEMDEFKVECCEREEREARKRVEESLTRLIKDKGAVEGSASPSVNDEDLSADLLDRLAKVLQEDVDRLSSALDVKPTKEEDSDKDTALSRCQSILSQWSAANGNSVNRLRNALLSAEMLSDDVMDVFKNRAITNGDGPVVNGK